MKRKKPISHITEENASPEALRILAEETARGRGMTNMKRTLLHDPVLFRTMDYVMETVNGQLKGKIPQRSLILFFHAIAVGNGCDMCGSVFGKVLAGMGIPDVRALELTEEEELLMDFAAALTADPNHVPDGIYERMQERYDEETMVALVMNSVFSLASNYFNTITGVEPDEELRQFLPRREKR